MTTSQEQKTEVMPRVLSLESCINCPKGGKFIPVVGNCFKLVGAGITSCPNNGKYLPPGMDVPAPATSDLIALPCEDGSQKMRLLYKATDFCQYCERINQGMASLILRAVCCSYSDSAKKQD